MSTIGNITNLVALGLLAFWGIWLCAVTVRTIRNDRRWRHMAAQVRDQHRDGVR